MKINYQIMRGLKAKVEEGIMHKTFKYSPCPSTPLN